VALIPTTLRLTALGRRPIGWPFNLEADVVAKTIVFWLERQANVRQSEVERRGLRTED
jgi:riboflavin synthase alpha subunit